MNEGVEVNKILLAKAHTQPCAAQETEAVALIYSNELRHGGPWDLACGLDQWP